MKENSNEQDKDLSIFLRNPFLKKGKKCFEKNLFNIHLSLLVTDRRSNKLQMIN
jgi:hypothetical protein